MQDGQQVSNNRQYHGYNIYSLAGEAAHDARYELQMSK